jgi:transcriptional regulator with XRE-family HTH domain
MTEKKMTVRELATILDTDQAVVSRYRHGLLPTQERRRRISKLLGTPQKKLWPELSKVRHNGDDPA